MFLNQQKDYCHKNEIHKKKKKMKLKSYRGWRRKGKEKNKTKQS